MNEFRTKINGKDLIIATGKYAKQANGSVTVQYGGTVVLITAVISKEAREPKGFLPLFVEYQEKTAAAGRIPGGFFKREGRPTQKEILTDRLIDRPIRPLFPKGMCNEIQIVALVLSSDAEYDPDVLGIVGASAALIISDIPFDGPIGAVRVARVEGKFIANPSYKEREESEFDLVIAGNAQDAMMVETGDCREVSEPLILEALQFGHEELQGVVKLQEEMVAACGKEKYKATIAALDGVLLAEVKKRYLARFQEINKVTGKEERQRGIDSLLAEATEALVAEDPPVIAADVRTALEEIEYEEARKLVLKEGRRVDGRDYTAVREVSCEVGVLPRTHGSGLFTRGQTQSLATTTLGTRLDEQMIEALEGKSYKRFMLHYNFPPFSVGEVKPMRGPGRRDIGHGALAERALKPVMPLEDEFPYTVRVVSEILESNGSSSMATICASTLALMDAGVPILKPVAGIAMGLIKEKEESVILTDIAGAEDHCGDMDFKVAGTKDGITALQMDIKTKGVSFAILADALTQAREARLFILGKMNEAIVAPRDDLSAYAPRITILQISTEKIGDVIGPGGKIIRKLTKDTGATIEIEDDGKVLIASNDAEASRKAIEAIKKLTEEPEVGKIYQGTVKRVMNFGAFCEILPGQEGLVHISEIASGYVKNIEDVVKLGDVFPVKLMEIDAQGRLNLSKKQAESDKSTESDKPAESGKPTESDKPAEG